MSMFLTCMQEDQRSLEDDAKLIAIESALGTTGGVLEVFSRIIPKAAQALTGLIEPISGYLKSDEGVRSMTAQNRKLLGRLNKLPFMAYREMLVQVPEGFNGNLLAYVKWVKKIQVEVVRSANALLGDYNTELSMFLSNNDYRKSLKSHEKFYKNVQTTRAEVTRVFESFFDHKGNQSRIKLGSIVMRFAELEVIFEEVEGLMGAVQLRTELSKLLASVAHASELLGLLKKKLDEKELDGVSGDMAKHISEGAYECGKYVELVAVLAFQSDALITSVSGISNQLEEVTG